jgi:hypothetical protein
MKKRMTFNDIVELDNALDTMVFGRPLGLFGEKANWKQRDAVKQEETSTPKKEEKPSPIGMPYLCEDEGFARCKTFNTPAQKLKGKVYEVASEPYKKEIRLPNSMCVSYITAIDIRSKETGLVYEVPFYETCLIKA